MSTTLTAAAGGALATHAIGKEAPPPTTGSIAHFLYRRQPAGPFIDSQRGDKAFGYADGKIFLSEDNGRTWTGGTAFADARNIVFSCILGNGNILFSAMAKLYLSTDNLKTYRQITVKDADGKDYIPHTPKNPARPGWYFHSLDGVHTWNMKGANGRNAKDVEMLIWGYYCYVIGGAKPVNIYYSTDGGKTVKIAYSFGQNPYNRDNGSGGGGTTGTRLGNPDNRVICRHIHCVSYNPAENAFYACTGDHDKLIVKGKGKEKSEKTRECHWLRGTYNAGADKWSWKVIVSASPNSRYKSGGINFVDGKLYWIADANGPKPHDRGVFRCDPADIANPAKHTRLFNPGVESANMIIHNGAILASHCAPASPMATGIIYSPDMGKTWRQYDLKAFGRRSPCRINRPNAEGWFRMDLRSGWVTPADVMFIKPKKKGS